MHIEYNVMTSTLYMYMALYIMSLLTIQGSLQLVNHDHDHGRYLHDVVVQYMDDIVTMS